MSVLFADVGLQQILDGDGFGIAMTGMAVVFVSLILISLAIALLAKLIDAVSEYLPELAGHGHGHGNNGEPSRSAAPAQSVAASEDEPIEKLVAAIGVAMHSRKSG